MELLTGLSILGADALVGHGAVLLAVLVAASGVETLVTGRAARRAGED